MQNAPTDTLQFLSIILLMGANKLCADLSSDFEENEDDI